MHGPYAGELEPVGDESREALAPEVSAALSAAQPAGSITGEAGGPGALLARYDPAQGALSLPATAFDTVGLDDGSPAVATRLRALADAAQTLIALHAAGRVHGDVRPGTVRVDATTAITATAPNAPREAARPTGRLVIVDRELGPAAPTLLRARLRAGAAPLDVAFAAPEVAGGAPASAAADVYGLAACAFLVLSGRAPLGRLDVGQVTRDLPDEIGPALSRALHPDPAERTSLATLASALSRAAGASADAAAFTLVSGEEAEVGAPAARARLVGPDEARTPEEAAAKLAVERQATGHDLSVLLILVLILGGVFVFFGAIGLVATSWMVIGDVGRFLLLALLTGGIWGGGRLLARFEYARSGFALEALGSQLLWADLIYVLVVSDRADEAGAWALGSACVVAVGYALALRRRSLVFGILAALGLIVTSSTLGEYLSSGSTYGPSVFLALVAAGYWGLAAVGVGLGRERELGLPFAVGAVLWTWGSATAGLLVFDQGYGRVWDGDAYGRREGWEALAAFGTLWPYALVGAQLALARALSGSRAAPATLIPLLGALGILLVAPGTQAGIAESHAYLAAATLLYVGLSLAGPRLLPAQAWLAPAFAALAVAATWISAGAALSELDGGTLRAGPRLWGTVWPYGLLGLHLALAHLRRPTSPADPASATAHVAPAPRAAWPAGLSSVVGVHLVAVLGLILFVPTAAALIRERELGYVFGAVAAGLLLLAGAFHTRQLSGRAQLPTILVALVSVTVAPALLCLIKCLGRDGLDLLQEALRSAGRVHETRFVYVSIVVGTAAGLVGLGSLFSAHAERKLAYRLLEGAGLLLFFGVLTLLSLPDVDEDVFYVGLLLTGGGAVLGLGLWARRATLVAAAALALILTLLIQYFGKLGAVLPWGLTAVGFGLGLLALGVLYEQRVKHLLPKLKEWA